MGYAVVGVCYRMPVQEEETDVFFFRKAEEFYLMGDLNYSDVYARGNTKGHWESMRFGEHIDSFLTQVTEELRKGALLGLTQTLAM